MLNTVDKMVPDENLEAYRILYIIEVGLRELIIERLENRDGHQWYKRRLPSDVLRKYKEGRERERNTHWTKFIHHDPLYYVDFPELAKIMETGTNWEDAFQEVFGRKDVLLGHLRSLEEIRNKVAHNRKVTRNDILLIQNVHVMIESAIRPSVLRSLVAKCSNADEAIDRLNDIHKEMCDAFTACENCKPVPPTPEWDSARHSRWLNIVRLSANISAIVEFFKTIEEYRELPSSWPGYKLERWMKGRHLDQQFKDATHTLSELRASLHHGD